MQHLTSLRLQNFMRLEAFAVEANGNHIIIEGRNGEGKTTVVESLFEALRGSSQKDRPEPVHHGADKALIVVELDDYTVEKHLTADGKSRLVVKAADGKRVSSPQKLLDGLLNTYCLDPVAFIDRRPQDQVDDVLAVCKIQPPVDQVQEITGEDCPPLPGESADRYLARLSADDVGEWYRRRRDAHRVVETNAGAVTKQKELAQAKAEACGQWRAIEEILADQEKAQAQQDAYAKAQAAHKETAAELEKVETLLATLKIDQATRQATIARLEKELAEERQKAEATAERLTRGADVVQEVQAEHQASKAALAQFTDCSATLAALRTELKASQDNNKKAIEAQTAATRLEELQQEHITSKNTHAKLDRELEALRALRKQILEGIDLGIEGLAVGEGELILHGVTFKQASNAQKIRVACAVAMLGDSELKLIRIDNGEALDTESRQFLLELAGQQGYQVIMTCVSDDSELQVEIVDRGPPATPEKKKPKGKLFNDQKTANQAGY